MLFLAGKSITPRRLSLDRPGTLISANDLINSLLPLSPPLLLLLSHMTCNIIAVRANGEMTAIVLLETQAALDSAIAILSGGARLHDKVGRRGRGVGVRKGEERERERERER